MLEFAGATAYKPLLDQAIAAYYDDMRAAVRRRGSGEAQATEVVHDLYVRLSGRPERLSGLSSVRAFLIRAAVNLGIDRLRRTAFERRLFAAIDVEAEATPASSRPIEEQLDRERRLRSLRDAIVELPPQRRRVFIAYRVGGMSKDDIAADLGIKRRMVDRHLRSALLHCLMRMEEFDGTPALRRG